MNNLYAFHGADSKTGVTMLAQSAAQLIASRRPDIDVLLLTLSGKRNAEYLCEESVTLDSLKTQLDSGIAIRKSAIRNQPPYNNLFVISGLSKEINERYYLPETAKRLIGDLSPQFKIIITDTGSRLDSGLAVGGLAAAAKRYFVLSQNEATLQRFERIYPVYRDMGLTFDKLIINKYYSKDPYNLEYIKKRLSVDEDRLITVSLSEAARKAEMEHRTLLEYRTSGFLKGAKKIADEIEKEAELGPPPERKRRNWKSFIWTNT